MSTSTVKSWDDFQQAYLEGLDILRLMEDLAHDPQGNERLVLKYWGRNSAGDTSQKYETVAYVIERPRKEGEDIATGVALMNRETVAYVTEKPRENVRIGAMSPKAPTLVGRLGVKYVVPEGEGFIAVQHLVVYVNNRLLGYDPRQNAEYQAMLDAMRL